MQEKLKLDREEIEHRVAVLKRFKALLQEQRNKFSEYLKVLEAQQKSISEDNVEAILKHTEMEQTIISDIFKMQKAVDPIEKIYKLANPSSEEESISGLKNDLKKLQDSVLEQNKKNRELLKYKMNHLRREISSATHVPKYAANVYADNSNTAALVDINS